VKKLTDVYGPDGKLRAEFVFTDIEEKLMERQRRLALDAFLGLGVNGYKVPKNIDVFIKGGFVWTQIANQKPWAVYVMVTAPNGVRRKRRRFNNLYEAVKYHRKIHKYYPSSGIVSVSRSYDLPAHLRLTKSKWPKRFKWCPRCAAPRVFKRVNPPQKFFAMVKRWNEDKGKYDWTQRQVWLTECQLCGCTNRDEIMRRSNLPYELRHIKKGVRRVKPRFRTERGKLAARARQKRRGQR
jgi:hypothetical protein